MFKPAMISALCLVLVACGPIAQQPPTPAPPTIAPTVALSATPPPSATPTHTPEPTATPEPTNTSEPTNTPEPTLTPTPDPVAGMTIPDLRARVQQPDFSVGEIEIGDVYLRGPNSVTYRMRYTADSLQLTGLVHVPNGEGPFPVIIANRGTISRDIYQPGMDSRAFSAYMVERGYLVVAPDFRGYAEGEDGPNPFYTGFYADVLGLIPLVQRLPMAQPGPIGMWGHSRGASVTVAALTISDQIGAAVVYAPAPADLAEDYARRFRQSGGNPGSDTWPFTPDENPDAYQRISPINYLDAVSAPVQFHHGLADTTTDASASIAVHDALVALGKESYLYLYEGGGHTLTGNDEVLYLQRSHAFFEEHLRRP